MFCENCGKKRIADEAFCEGCGHPFPKTESNDEAVISKEISEPIPEPKVMETTEPKPETNGDIQWMYEYSLWKNPTILITTAKVLLIALLVPVIFMFVITLSDGFMEAFNLSIMILFYGIIVMAILLAIAYPLIALRYGGSYFVLFKMDDKGVNHIQLDKQFKKAQAMGFLTALIGLSAGNLTTAGTGLMAATKQSLYTSFKKVKSIKVVKSRNTIYINESLSRNQIYATRDNFDSILEHILNNCPKSVKVTYK
jgi:hypothetical protein